MKRLIQTLLRAAIRPFWIEVCFDMLQNCGYRGYFCTRRYAFGLWQIAIESGDFWPLTPTEALSVDMTYWED